MFDTNEYEKKKVSSAECSYFIYYMLIFFLFYTLYASDFIIGLEFIYTLSF